MNSILYTLFFCLPHSISIYSADQTSLSSLPPEIYSIIANKITRLHHQKDTDSHIISTENPYITDKAPKNQILISSQYQLLIPSTLRIINLKKTLINNDEKDITDQDDTVLPAEQCWRYKELPYIQLINNLQHSNATYKIGQKANNYYYYPHNNNVSMWDGINNNGISIYGRQLGTNLSFNIYMSKQNKNCIIFLKNKIGQLNAITLHNNHNRFILSRTTNNQNYVAIYDIVLEEKWIRYTTQLILQAQTDSPLKKIIPLDLSTYLALNNDGQLFRLDVQKTKLTLQANIIIHEQKYPQTIQDIAFNKNAIKTDERVYNIAFLTTNGEILVTDLQLFAHPTMVLIRTLKDHSSDAHLYYDTNQIGIMYYDNKVENAPQPTQLECFPDCYELVYLKALIKKLSVTNF